MISERSRYSRRYTTCLREETVACQLCQDNVYTVGINISGILRRRACLYPSARSDVTLGYRVTRVNFQRDMSTGGYREARYISWNYGLPHVYTDTCTHHTYIHTTVGYRSESGKIGLVKHRLHSRKERRYIHTHQDFQHSPRTLVVRSNKVERKESGEERYAEINRRREVPSDGKLGVITRNKIAHILVTLEETWRT